MTCPIRSAADDWFVTRPRLTGICGSDSKQILLDFGDGDSDNAMSGVCSFPQVMGHEVVAEVIELGPRAEGFDVGQRVVLNPWLSCAPRGISPLCPACEAGDLSLCWSFTAGEISTGIHTGVSSDATGGYAELMPAHSSDALRRPRRHRRRARHLRRPVLGVAAQHHPPPAAPAGRVLVWGAGSLGSCAVADPARALPETSRSAWWRASTRRPSSPAKLGAHRVFRPGTQQEMVEELAAWSGGVLRPTMEGLPGVPMCHPGGIDVAYDTVGKPETFEVGGAGAQGARHAREERRARAGPLGVEPALLQGDQLGRLQRLRRRGGRGRRQHAIQHYLDLVQDGRIDLTGMLTHTFALDEWQDAFAAIADQERSGAIKVAIDQR